jgi:hypothetical protein
LDREEVPETRKHLMWMGKGYRLVRSRATAVIKNDASGVLCHDWMYGRSRLSLIHLSKCLPRMAAKRRLNDTVAIRDHYPDVYIEYVNGLVRSTKTP